MPKGEVVITTPTRTLVIGSQDEVGAALQTIWGVTGGSSGAGRWSTVARIDSENVEMTDEHVRRLSLEARDLDTQLAHALPAETRAFLDRLAMLNDQST